MRKEKRAFLITKVMKRKKELFKNNKSDEKEKIQDPIDDIQGTFPLWKLWKKHIP
jgi:hypothetical protein